MLNNITDFIDTHPIGRVFTLGEKEAVWKRVTELKAGMKIAIASTSEESLRATIRGGLPTTPEVEWNEIVEIKSVGRERVYDIEVEGTHNFVGNGILAHNTEQLRLGYDVSNYASFTTGSTGDLTINPTGGQVIFADTATLNIGGLSNVAYNAFANAADTPTATNITADNDVFVGGDLELKGGLYLTGKNIYNTVGGVSTSAVSLAADPAAINSYNSLSYGSWLVQNSVNNGIAALMVDQTKGGDIFTASASGTPKFVITNAGNVGIGTTGPTQLLHVYQNTTSVSSGILIEQAGTGDSLLQFLLTGAIRWSAGVDNSDSDKFKISNVGDLADGTVLTIDTSGNVGIGTTAPSSALDIEKAGTAKSLTNLFELTNSGNAADMDGTVTGILFNQAYSGGTIVDAGNITVGTETDWTSTASTQDAFMSFSTVLDGTMTEWMRINSNGKIGINDITPDAKLDIDMPAATTQGTAFGLSWGTVNSDGTMYGIDVDMSSVTGNAIWPAVGIRVSDLGTAAVGAEYGIWQTGTDWDYGIRAEDDVSFERNTYLGNANADLVTVNAATTFSTVNTANTGLNSVTLSGTLAAFNGSDTFRGLYLNYTNANHTGASNYVYGMDIANITGDADATETAINIGTGWDNSIAGEGVLSLVGATGVSATATTGNVTLASTAAGINLTTHSDSGDDFTVNTNKLVVEGDTGNVGIGTTGPGSKLAVSGNAVIGSGYAASAGPTDGLAIQGNVGIGTTSPGTHALSVVGTAGLSTGTAWTNTSDIRLKTIESNLMGSSLDKIMALHPVSFRWNELHNEKFGSTADKLNLGFVAQELETVLPDMISTDSEGYKWYNPSGFEALLTAGLQEQQIQIASLVGQLADKIGTFAQIVAANIRAGAITTKHLVSDQLVSLTATIDNLLINNGLVSPIVETNLISPLADSSDVVIKIGKTATSGEPELTPEESLGKLAIQNAQGEEVASIDTSGQVTADSVQVNTASISGELYADTIKSKTLDEIQELLRKVETDQDLLAQAADWGTNTATDSASLTAIADSAQLVNSEQLTVNSFFVTGQAAISSLSVSNSFAVGSDFVVQSLTTDHSSPFTSINTLTAPLSLQSLAMAPIEMMAGKVRIDTNGNMIITGNLNIAGDLEVGGKTKLKEVELTKLIIANSSTSGEPGLTPEVSTASGIINTNATAGKAVIPAGMDQIVINNPNITDYTLIYVTPTSTTNNNVLYVKSKETGKFVVGFTNLIDIDVAFNWWIIEVQSWP